MAYDYIFSFILVHSFLLTIIVNFALDFVSLSIRVIPSPLKVQHKSVIFFSVLKCSRSPQRSLLMVKGEALSLINGIRMVERRSAKPLCWIKLVSAGSKDIPITVNRGKNSRRYSFVLITVNTADICNKAVNNLSFLLISHSILNARDRSK